MRLDTLFLLAGPLISGCGGGSSDSSSAAPEGDEGDEEDEASVLTEICDGHDNDDDGLVDPSKVVIWYDGINDEFRTETAIGVTSLHTKRDGDAGFFGPVSPYNSDLNEWAIVASDGFTDEQSVGYYNSKGLRTVFLDDSDGDGQVDKTAAYSYAPDSDLLTEYKYYYNSVFRLVRKWSSVYTSLNTPDGQPRATYVNNWGLIDWDGNFFLEECFGSYSPTSLYTDCRNAYSVYGISERNEIQEAWVGGVRRLQHTIVNGNPSTETLYDSSGNTVLVRWGDPGPREVWTWDTAGELTSRIATSYDGEQVLSAIYYTHHDGLTASVEFDEDGDGEIDLIKTAIHEGGRLISYAESRFGEEVSPYVEPPISGVTIDYDESLSVRQISYDWDGDGIGDVIYDYIISCEPAEHGFDPDNFDHDGDGYSVADGDCDDENPNLTPDEGC